MSYNETLITKLSHEIPKDTCCRLALLSAIVKFDGSIHLGKNSLKLELRINNMALARQVIEELKSLFALTTDIRIRKINLNKTTQGQLIISKDPQLKEMLRKIGIIKNSHLNLGLPTSLLRRACCKSSFLRGAFMAAGYISHSSKYAHLEIASENQHLINDLATLLKTTQLPSTKTRVRDNYYSLYLKGHKNIATFLKLINASKEALEFENALIIRKIKNRANRLVNAETANTNKRISNAFAQIKEINLIENTIGLVSLPRALKDISRLRLKYPKASLKDLGLKSNPALSKSAVNHRFRRIRQITDEISKEHKKEVK